MIKNFLTALMILVVLQANSQATKKTTIKSKFPDTKEVFYVLKEDGQTKHGTYSISLGGNQVCSGTYSNGKQSGNWEFYNSDGGVEQIVNFDNFELVENNSDKNQSPEPVLLGGIQMLYNTLGRTLMYPSDARRRGTQGRVFVSFTVDEQGIPGNFEVAEGIGDGCDEEALRVFRTINLQYFPALNEQGERISSKVTMPVYFKLAN